MPNSPDIGKYPVLLLDAFHKAEKEDPVVIECSSPSAAKNLRGLCYTLRRLLSSSPEAWHMELATFVAKRKFYIDGSNLVISSPMYQAQLGIRSLQ
jgi:hypothetical protein